jgi:hypothetical protein
MATVLKVLGALVGVGMIAKVSIIGYYPNEVPFILAAGVAGAVLFWLGSRLDGWDHPGDEDARRGRRL